MEPAVSDHFSIADTWRASCYERKMFSWLRFLAFLQKSAPSGSLCDSSHLILTVVTSRSRDAICVFFFSWVRRLRECEIWGRDRHWPVKQSKLTPTQREIKLLQQHTASTGFENANSSSALNFVPFKVSPHCVHLRSVHAWVFTYVFIATENLSERNWFGQSIQVNRFNIETWKASKSSH